MLTAIIVITTTFNSTKQPALPPAYFALVMSFTCRSQIGLNARKSPSSESSTLRVSSFPSRSMFKSAWLEANVSGVLSVFPEKSVLSRFEPYRLIFQSFQISVLLRYPSLSLSRQALDFRQQ